MPTKGNPVFGAAVLKLTLAKRLPAEPAMRELYTATLRDLGVSAAEVEAYVAAHRDEIEAAMARKGGNGSDNQRR